MATKIFMHLPLSFKKYPLCGGGWGDGAALGFWNGDTATFGYVGGSGIAADTTQGTGAQSGNITSVNGPTTLCAGCCVSPPLSAGFTLSGTVTFNVWASESSLNANAGVICRLYKRDAATGTLTQVVGDSAKGTELGTSAAVQNWTATPTSTVFNRGDQLVWFIGFTDAGGTMVSGFTLGLRYDGATGADGDTYVQLNENVTFESATPAGTQLNLLTTLSPVSDGGDEREMWTGSGSTDTAIAASVAGPASPQAWTKTSGGTQITWYSRKLDAVTLSGPIRVTIAASNGAAANSWPYVELARVDQDGSNALVFGYGLLSEDGGSGEPGGAGDRGFQAGNSFASSDIGIATTAFTDGQRIRLRLFQDDNYRHTSTRMGAADTTLTFGDTGSHIILSDSATEFSVPPSQKQYKRLYGPAHMAATTATIFTATGPTWVRHILITNPTGSTRTVTLSIGADGAASRVFDARTIPPGGRIDERKAAEHWLEAGEVIAANSDAASACVILVDGITYEPI